MRRPGCRCGWHRAEGADSLKRELGRKLKESRRRGGLDLAERRARDVAVHGASAVELRAVEDVERFEADFEVPRFLERHALRERDVEVLDARPVEEPAGRIAKLSECRHAEAIGVEGR